MRYFTIEECTRSDTAVAKGIDNTPSPDTKDSTPGGEDGGDGDLEDIARDLCRHNDDFVPVLSDL